MMKALGSICLAACLVWIVCSPAAEGRTFIRGDADADGTRQITDAVRIFSYLFLGGAALPCADAADVDDSGSLEITDGIYLLGYLFLGGPPPPAPFPSCGEDPGEDALGCARFPPCDDANEEACRAAGGVVEIRDCCAGGPEFPSLCAVGACGCAPDHSRPVRVCICPEGLCWDGSDCVPIPEPEWPAEER
ncbi:MAG: hypothetical protein JXA90_11665 [Planctomycetes bacterium]|nr:hypothetical protein [Planctomycetota bacterium]